MNRVATLGAVLAAAAALLVPAGVATADDCPDVEVIFARGTGEPPGLGRVGQALVDALAPRLGDRTMDTYAVNYPASFNFLAAASGADDAAARIADMGARCPQTRLVLGGFSQGAAAVSMLAGVPPVGQRIGSIGSAPPLPPAGAGQVAAVAVFGNPGARFGSPLSSTGQFAGRAIDICSGGDPICSAGLDRAAHSNYELPPYPDQAANFVAGLI
ncbi:cutinase [Mycolicibacterium sp. BK556]|uniref:cutinase family protein n=1 Tax=Mycobacteriaceae TaxID=1762 RepID=UPI00105D734A|nr:MULTISPECIES: cutinase family protein [Mycobacteriaceae]MBB3603480.1 cutinase [Mycolicibacterium sp. BK556]MBB3633675.1 cutinase [Mycolicibacterium sp. BK607]MBB3751257.1 cutinase [Mycolicibacterium sp. BK634]TDO11789.1 cutinase [Mycobacterium sp. BK086]